MKYASSAPVILLALMPWACTGGKAPEDPNARTITRVVNLLQGMVDKSKEEGDLDRELYAKFKCYCDREEESHKMSIKKLTTEISIFESEIEALRGSNGELSASAGKLKFDMAENEQARTSAQGLRQTAHEAFLATEADLSAAIGQMNEAIQVLTDIGSDQTLSEGADHTKFMSSYDRTKTPLALLKSNVKAALLAASSVLKSSQQRKVETFLQAPFTGTYTSQSAEVLGILKDMRDTFTSNLESARATEAAQVKAHDAYMSAKLAEWNVMDSAYDKAQERMASNDGSLGIKTSQLAQAKNQLAEDEDFLAKLTPLCAEKAKRYEERKMLRTSEESALAEAIAILNSDAAFVSFGKVDATLRGPLKEAFIQFASVRKHMPTAKFSPTLHLQALLQRDASSPRLSRVLALLEAGNPFTVVLEEIATMLQLLDSEDKADSDKLSWCTTERATSNSKVQALDGQIIGLSLDIDALNDLISHPETGLEVQIANTEDDLKTNRDSQISQTEQRTKENLLYQKDVAVLVDTQDLLRRAIEVLEKYYTSLEKHYPTPGFLQGQKKDDPAPPALFKDDKDFVGQSVKGTDAISMLNFIKRNTKQEEDTAHKDEGDAQRAFEDSMAGLTAGEKSLESQLATLQENLATAHVNLLAKKDDRKKATAQKDAVLAYLADIKPGCDFITSKITERDDNRGKERAALQQARNFIKGTAHYNNAVLDALHESWGSCREICKADSDHTKCKACLADVTVPAYCAGHPTTKGCN